MLTNISRGKCNQAMEFGQLIEYKMRNIFFENYTRNMVEKLFPGSFLKNQNWAYVWISNLKFYADCFYCMASLRLSRYIETKLQTTWQLTFTSYKVFSKNKKSGTSFPDSFFAWLLKKNISFVIFHYLTKLHCLVVFTSWDIGQYVYCNCLLTRLWRHKFWN